MDCITAPIATEVENGNDQPPTTSPWPRANIICWKYSSLAAAPCIKCRSQPTRYKTNKDGRGNRIGNNFLQPWETHKGAFCEGNLCRSTLTSTHTRNVTTINIFNPLTGPFGCCVAGNGAHVYVHAPISSIQNKSIQNGRRLRLQLAALTLRDELPVQRLP